MAHAASTPQEIQQAIQQQAGKLLTQVAGYVGVRTMDIGLRFGLFEEISKHPQGITPNALAEQMGLDSFYAQVWCRSAYASEALEQRGNETYILAPHMDKLLLDQDFPGYLGGLPRVVVQPEMFDRFAENFQSGRRIWWDECSPTWIQMVSSTGRPFYNRLIPGGLSQIPGLSDRLAGGASVLELACGAGIGLVRMAQTYPRCSIVGLDGDAYSLELVANRLGEEALKERVSLVYSTLEDFDASDEYDVVVINISMHECRDIEKATANMYRALKPGGYFVISDFPFPNSTEGCRTVPASVMCGIQFFEALIDDQLMSTKAFVDLLHRHGFRDVGAFDINPVHAVTYGQK